LSKRCSAMPEGIGRRSVPCNAISREAVTSAINMLLLLTDDLEDDTSLTCRTMAAHSVTIVIQLCCNHNSCIMSAQRPTQLPTLSGAGN